MIEGIPRECGAVERKETAGAAIGCLAATGFVVFGSLDNIDVLGCFFGIFDRWR
jgi:hypothetical protein